MNSLMWQIIKSFQFDWRYMLRGLTIDKKRGNILKIDRHKYVKLAHHGFEPLTHEQRLSTYNAAEVSASNSKSCFLHLCRWFRQETCSQELSLALLRILLYLTLLSRYRGCEGTT